MKRLWMLSALALVACNEEADPIDLAGPAATVTTMGLSGGRAAGVGETIQLAVRVADADGRPIPAYPVSWSAERGTIPAVDSTDDEGISQVEMVLPDTPGSDEVWADAGSLGGISFTVLTQPIGGTIAFRYLDAGGYHACGITTTEQLLCWGYGADGQLGLGSPSPRVYPTLITGDLRYRMVTGGYYHSCGFTLATQAQCWGSNTDGRLGGGGSGGQSEVPVQVVESGVGALLVQDLRAGFAHSCAIDLSQHALCWGRNAEGQVGTGGIGGTVGAATRISSTEGFKAVTVGGLHSCGITVGGDGRCWGYNVAGQLGNGSDTSTGTPTAVAGGPFRTGPVIFHSPDPDFPLPLGPFMAAGYNHTCGITVAGPTLCWGLNQDGQLGDSTFGNRTTPTAVSGGHTFAGITAGLRHSCALDMNGAAWCWGDNRVGQLGDGTRNRSSTPVAVSGEHVFAYIKSGELFTCGVTSEGAAYCWGDNEYGQLGEGTFTPSAVPVKVAFQP